MTCPRVSRQRTDGLGRLPPGQEVREVALVVRNYLDSGLLVKAELVRFIRPAWADEPLPLGRASHVFNVSAVAIGGRRRLENVTPSAIRTFHDQTRRHGLSLTPKGGVVAGRKLKSNKWSGSNGLFKTMCAAAQFCGAPKRMAGYAGVLCVRMRRMTDPAESVKRKAAGPIPLRSPTRRCDTTAPTK